MTVEWTAMDAMRRTAAARLSAMLDAPLNPDSLRPELPAADDRATRDSAHTQSPDLIAAHHSVEAAAAAEALARRERWPELEVGLSLGQRPNSTERMVSVMAGASIPLFARQRQHQMIQEMVAMRRMAEADARGAAADNRAGVVEATAALERTRTLQRLYDGTLLPQLVAVRESADAAYRAGTGSIESVIDALMSLNTARIARLTLHADEVRALARLEPLTGRAWLAAPLATENHP
jgi:outer membrane protein TolC